MTLRELAMKHLTERGLFPQEAEAVIKCAASRMDVMQGRWDDDIEGYPPQFRRVLMVTMERDARDWIDANKPLHWARPLFCWQHRAEAE